MSTDHNPVVSSNPSPNSYLEPATRKVSIVDGPHGHDNPAFESPRSRKVSGTSDHAEIGPVRKKSILHNSYNHENTSLSGISDSGKQHANGDARSKKHSVADSVYSKTRFSDIDDDDKSWWYQFCLTCRPKDSHPSWQPKVWPKMCPYPFCPTYRQFSRLISLALIGVLSYCVLYAIVGEAAAAPNGKLFQLIILAICGHFAGWLVSLTTLPRLIGMLFTGLLFQNVNIVNIDESFTEITKELRNVALVILLIRAGLDLDPHALKRLKWTVIKLGLIPWAADAAIVGVASHFLIDLTWQYAFALGSVIAAVSPAVLVPCLIRLRTKGYGVAKGIPTLIIAVASIDDAVSVAFFGIVKTFIFSNTSVSSIILQGPVAIIGGIGFGILWGVICNYTPEKYDPFVVPLRVLLLLVGGLISIFGSDLIGYGGAGPLACVTAAFTCLVSWSNQGWEIEENPATTAFEIFWMIFEPILFGITGAQVKLNELEGDIVTIGLGILLLGVVVRMIITVLVGIGCNLNLKEKMFVAMAWSSKATVQAALGPVLLGLLTTDGKTGTAEYEMAERVLMVCVLSIMLTAPTGAILVTFLGPLLLTKTKAPVIPEGWRRSHRPSIRDISIIDEEEEREPVQHLEDNVSHKDKSLSEV